MHALIGDLRYAIRQLSRNPGWTLAAILCLGLGIGANTAMFTVINAVLLRPLPYANPQSLVGVWSSSNFRKSDRNSISPADYLDWQAQNTVFESMAALREDDLGLAGAGEPEQIRVQVVTATFFPMLGIPPELGRTFNADEDEAGGPSVTVLSHALWVRRFAADPSVLGRTVSLGGTPFTVIGVMPSDAKSVGRHEPQLWIPLALDRTENYRVTAGRYLRSFARLKPGVTAEQAQTELATVAARLEQQHPEFNTGWSVRVVPLTDQLVGQARAPLLVVAGVALVVLLIACANVANLQLAQAATRRREIALRAAMGASPARVGRQFVTESVVVSLLGGAVGVLLAYWGTALLAAAAATGIPRIQEIGVDGRALLFTLLVSLASGIAFGSIPALHAVRSDVEQSLREGSRTVAGGSSRTQAALVGGQIALSLVLLVGGGLLLKSFARLQEEELGFDPRHLLTARLTLGSAYNEPEQQVRFFQDLLARVRGIPGVRSAGAINWLPLSGSRSATDVLIEGEPLPPTGQAPGADIRAVDPDFIRTMGIHLLRGRGISPSDGPDAAKAVVVSQSFVQRYLGGRDPLGRRILMEWDDTLVGTVVGVVADTKHTGLDSLPSPTIYWAHAQFPSSFMTLVVRTEREPDAIARAIRAQVSALDREQPLADVRPFDEYLGDALARRRVSLTLVGGFALLALVLTAIGLYGTTAYSVVRRTREFGIRLALGASRRSVISEALTRTLRIAAAGAVIGLVSAAGFTRVLSSLLYQVSATDPAVFAGIVPALAGVVALASWLPARRASRVDPMTALRSE